LTLIEDLHDVKNECRLSTRVVYQVGTCWNGVKTLILEWWTWKFIRSKNRCILV